MNIPTIDETPRLKPTVSSWAFIPFFVFPFIGTVYALYVAFQNGVSLFYIGLFLVMLTITGLGTTAGYHRLLTHEAFQAVGWVRRALIIAGIAAVQGSPITWAADHAGHHQTSDTDKDIHSPHRRTSGKMGVLMGFFHAHFGWMFTSPPPPRNATFERLSKDDDVVACQPFMWLWIILGFAVPALLGALHEQSLHGAFLGFLWGGAVRLFCHQHITSSVNSITHLIGSHRFNTGPHDQSRDLWWLAPFTFGESWHNFHHAFANSAVHGYDYRWLDPTYLFIRLLEKVGLAWDLKIPKSADVQSKRLQPGQTNLPGI